MKTSYRPLIVVVVVNHAYECVQYQVAREVIKKVSDSTHSKISDRLPIDLIYAQASGRSESVKI